MKRVFNEKTNTMSVVDANDHKTDFLLRENWDVLNITDPEGFVYQNIYDNNDKLIKFKYPDGESELTDYDDFGRLVKFTGRAGKEVKFEYDEKDRIVSLPNLKTIVLQVRNHKIGSNKRAKGNKAKRGMRPTECARQIYGVQGWFTRESTRLPRMWPGFDSQIRRHNLWVLNFLVLYSVPGGFLRVLRFPLSSKNQHFI